MSIKASIDKKTLEYLAELGRIELDKKSEDKLLGDLQKILEHFKELEEVDTENIEPMSGANIFSANVFREDEFIEVDKRGRENLEADLRGKPALSRAEGLIDQFPEKENGYLKIPPVFE